jgi:hypothetical protein
MHSEHPSQEERRAARRYLEHDYASQHLTGRASREANLHAQQIDETHPRARDIALTGTARELGQLPKHLRAHQRHTREQAGITIEHAARIRHQYRTQPSEPRDGEPRAPEARPPAAQRVTDAASQAASTTIDLVGTGASAAADSSWGSLIGEMILGGIGLSIAYLLLTHNQGASKLFQGATTVTRAIVSPVIDPLNPKGVQ